METVSELESKLVTRYGSTNLRLDCFEGLNLLGELGVFLASWR